MLGNVLGKIEKGKIEADFSWAFECRREKSCGISYRFL
jgi:hypothetical protein